MKILGIEVLREVRIPIKIAVFQDVTQYDLVGKYWRFDGTFCLYLEARCTAMNTTHTLVLTQKQQTIQWLTNSVGIKKVKLSLLTPLRHVGAEEAYVCWLLTSALDGDELSTSGPGRFTHRERTPVPTEQKVGWAPESVRTSRRKGSFVGPAWVRTPDRPARSLVTVLTTQSWVLTLMGIDTNTRCYGVIILKWAFK